MVAALKHPAAPLRWNHASDDTLVVAWVDDKGPRVSFLAVEAAPHLRRGYAFTALRLTELPDTDTLDELASDLSVFGRVHAPLARRCRYYDHALDASPAFVKIARVA